MTWTRAVAVMLCAVCVTLAPIGHAGAAPFGLLDRNGSYVSIEPYAPNIVRVTLSVDKNLALAAPGYGFIGAADAAG